MILKSTILFFTSTHTHTHTHTHLFLWIVGTFHRLLLLLYWPNNIFYHLTLNLPLTENLFTLLHSQINIINNTHTHKSSHLYLNSAFNNTDCVKALNSIKLELEHTHTPPTRPETAQTFTSECFVLLYAYVSIMYQTVTESKQWVWMDCGTLVHQNS